MSEEHKNLGRELLVVLVAGLLAGIGGFLGAWTQQQHERAMWTIDANKEAVTYLLESRIKLLERTTAILSKPQLLSAVSDDLKVMLASAEAQLVQGNMAEAEERFKRVVETKIRLNEFFSEYATVLHLATVLYGPVTKQEIDALARHKHWWEAEEKEIFAVIEAMKQELSFGLEQFSIHKEKG